MAELTTKKRNNLKASTFALPEKRAYPIPDESHARNALARVSQHGSPDEKKKVRAAVHRKFPGIGQGSGKLTMLGQKTLGRLQAKLGDDEGKRRFHGQVKAGHLEASRMFVNGGKD
jgi:hypothetical protein